MRNLRVVPLAKTTRHHHRSCDGQATVEFALLAPILLCMSCLLLDIAWLAVDQCLVNDASRAAVRAAIVESHDSHDVATRTVHRILGDSTDINVVEADGLATVHVSRTHEFVTPLIGRLLPHVRVRASTTMLIEPETTTIGNP